jgi:hypothetical protein
MAADEMLHSRFVKFRRGQTTFAYPTRKMLGDLHISLDARQNVASGLKK